MFNYYFQVLNVAFNDNLHVVFKGSADQLDQVRSHLESLGGGSDVCGVDREEAVYMSNHMGVRYVDFEDVDDAVYYLID